MKKSVKIIIAVFLAVICAVAVIVSVNMPLAVAVTRLVPENARVTFTEQGSYTYADDFQIYPLVSGEVLELHVKEGDTVRAGDVLAVISATDYEHQITLLEATIDGYSAQIENLSLQEEQEKDALRGTLDSLAGQLYTLDAQIRNEMPIDESLTEQMSLQQDIIRQARKNVEQAEDDFDLVEDMYKGNQLGYSDYSAAKQALATAKSNYYAAQILLEQLRTGETPQGVLAGQKMSVQAQIATANARIAKSYTGAMARYYTAQIDGVHATIAQMQEKRGQATITAPISGVIEQLPIKNANIISQQGMVAVIGTEELIEVYVPVREIDNVKRGDKIELILDKRFGDETLAAEIVLVESKAETRLSALGVEERKVRVLAKPDSPALLIGQELDVRFTVYMEDSAIVVPKTAVFTQDGADCVWLVTSGKAQLQPITKGVETREGYTVTEGLVQDDIVVTDADNQSLAVGKKVALS